MQMDMSFTGICRTLFRYENSEKCEHFSKAKYAEYEFRICKAGSRKDCPSGMPIIFLDLYIQLFKAGFGNFASGSGQQSEHQHPEKQHKELGG